MSPNDFIIDKLNQLVELFPDVMVRYKRDVENKTNIVEVLPLNIYENVEAYLEFESIFESEFETYFNDESIMFISEGSLTEIKNADLEIKPGRYSQKFAPNDCILLYDFINTGYSSDNFVFFENNYALAA
jgi:hypothetical protein